MMQSVVRTNEDQRTIAEDHLWEVSACFFEIERTESSSSWLYESGFKLILLRLIDRSRRSELFSSNFEHF